MNEIIDEKLEGAVRDACKQLLSIVKETGFTEFLSIGIAPDNYAAMTILHLESGKEILHEYIDIEETTPWQK